MAPEQEKLLQEILKSIVSACYNEMGEAWYKAMMNNIEELKSVGKP